MTESVARKERLRKCETGIGNRACCREREKAKVGKRDIKRKERMRNWKRGTETERQRQ